MAALTRLAKPSAISHHSRRFYCNIGSSSPISHSASSYNPHLTKPTRSINDSTNRSIQWVFLGSPAVSKGTYANNLSNLLGVPHIATSDLVREELAASGPLSHQLSEIVNQGKLVSNEIIINLLSKRLEAGEAKGELGFILDGFPRTI